MSPDIALDEATVSELAAAMADGRATAVALTEAYLARIADLDQAGPRVNSVIETNPDAQAIAAGLDDERTAGRIRGPLHGIPILIKDNIATSDQMETTAGSLALVGARPARDAVLVEQLRAAGAVIIGKTNLSEWANCRSIHSVSGWSGRGGLTRNPYALDRNPSGSSSGTGAAIAANLAAVGVGTETDGSIVAPSTANGLAGIKPTVGLVSQVGIIPISRSQDTAGPMARTVTDAAILLEGLTGRSFSLGEALDPDGLRGARIGVVRPLFEPFGAAVCRVAESAIDVLRDAGAVVVEVAEFPSPRVFEATEVSVLLYEFKAGLNAYLAELPSGPQPRTLAEVIAFNVSNRDRELAWFEQELFEEAEAKGPLTDPAYLDTLADNQRIARDEGIDRALRADRLDALFAPTGEPARLTDFVTGTAESPANSTFPAVAGYPHVTVPAGLVHGLPLGVSFFGTAGAERSLIRYAYAFEQATHARRPPTFRATVEGLG